MDNFFNVVYKREFSTHYLFFCYRLSSNSRNEHSYQSVESDTTPSKELPRVNTPANLSQSKPIYAQNQETHNNPNERMVSPKRKIEHFPHLYVANNVKTATFNEQADKNNLSNSKNNLVNNEFVSKYTCNHTSINMVPERDTGPSGKVSAGQVTTLGSLHLPACHGPTQNTMRFKGEVSGCEETRMVQNRPHHHVSVQELRLQVLFTCIK